MLHTINYAIPIIGGMISNKVSMDKKNVGIVNNVEALNEWLCLIITFQPNIIN